MTCSLDLLCWLIWAWITLCGRSMQCYCWHFPKAFAQWWELTVEKKAANVMSDSESDHNWQRTPLCCCDTKRILLYVSELHLHTNHNNILNIGDFSQCWLHWISYVNEYGPELHYVEEPHNVIAETFSRLSRNDVSSRLVEKNKANNGISDSESDN